MDFQIHLKILRDIRANIKAGIIIRHIYELIKEHEGKDFKDIDDFFTKLYPKNLGRRESPFYDTPIQNLKEEANQ